MTRLKEKYQKEVRPKLKEEFDIKNDLAVPTLQKIVINIGVGDAKDNKAVLDRTIQNLAVLAGQQPVVTKAKRSISGFKVAKEQIVGVMVTLRGIRMYEFLDKLMNIVLPKVRDFRGLSDTAFDGQGNYSIGLREQNIFPEVSFQPAIPGKVRGLEISIVTTADNKEQGKRLLELLGMPFKKSYG